MRCCFIGHKDVVGIEKEIDTAIEKLIKSGVTEFYSGGMGNFDKMCESAVQRIGARLIFVPYSVKQIKEKVFLFYDETVCPNGNKEYSKYDIPNRNKWLVDNCDICFCYVYKDGGAKHTLDYAVKKNKQVINLYTYQTFSM